MVVALGYKKAPGSKVKDANHEKPKPAAHGGNSAAHGKAAAVASSRAEEPEIDDRYEHMMNSNWKFIEEHKDEIN